MLIAQYSKLMENEWTHDFLHTIFMAIRGPLRSIVLEANEPKEEKLKT